MSQLIARREASLKRLAVFTLLLIQISSFYQISLAERSIFEEPNESEYDPERAADGPVVKPNSGSDSHQATPKVYQWNTEDEPLVKVKSQMNRRADDRDPEDEFDDDERDEAKSGSNQHGSFEEPAFGESLKAAKDGEEIESFFDKHLGPQDPTTASSSNDKESQAQPDAEADSPRPTSIERADPEDKYEMAASSPLTGIIQSLITGHKPRIVIKTMEEAPAAALPSSPLASASNNNLNQQQPAQQKPANMVVNSQLGPFVQGSPFLDDHRAQGALIQQQQQPYYGPMAQSSMAMSHEQPMMAQGPMMAPVAAASVNEDQSEAPIREIYIARRPSVLQHFRSHASALGPPLQRLVQQSSNINWQQQQPIRQDEQSAASSDYMYRPQVNQQMAAYQMNQQGQMYQPQMGLYNPMMANSYARQQRFRQASRPEASDSEEPTTVSYGLRFGGASLLGGGSSLSSSDEDSADNGPEEQSSAANEPGPQYGANQRVPMQGRYASSGTRAYNSYNNNPWPVMAAGANVHGPVAYPPAAMAPQQYQQQLAYQQQVQQQMQQKRLQQHQHHHHGAGYHRDPSESAAAPINSYGQLSPFLGDGQERQSWTRQKLLADLDQQIKSNPHYRNGFSPINQASNKGSPITIQSTFKAHINNLDKDVDSFSSFHSEADPFKSVTTSAKLVKDSHKQSDPDDSDDGMDAAATKNQIEDHIIEPRHDGLANNTSGSFEFRHEKCRPFVPSQPVIGAEPASQKGLHQMAVQGDGQLKFGAKLSVAKSLHRVRRDDPDDRENDDVDDDGVWVDDDDDDDNKQTASDVNETTQDPKEGDDDSQQVNDERQANFVPGVIGNPHGYEIDP